MIFVDWLNQLLSNSSVAGIILVLVVMGVFFFSLSHLLPCLYKLQKENCFVKQRLNSLCRVSNDGIITIDSHGKITSLNTRAENLSGFVNREVVGSDVSEVFRIADSNNLEVIKSPVLTAIKENRIIKLSENSILLSGFGERIPVSGYCVPIYNQNSEYGGALIVFNQRYENIEESDYDLQTNTETRVIYDNLSVGIVLLNRDMRILKANPQMKKWFSETDYTQHPYCFTVFNNPECRRVCSDCPVVKTLSDKGYHSIERVIEIKGETRHFRILAVPVLDSSGNIRLVAEIVEDITEVKLATMRILENESRLRTITETAQDAIIMINADGFVLFWNPAAEKIFGYNVDEALKLRFADMLKSGHQKGRCKEILGGLLVSNSKELLHTEEFQAIRKNGAVIDISVSLTGVDLSGQRFATGIIRNITDQNRIKADLIQTNKQLETSISQIKKLAEKASAASQVKNAFLANVSHEIRTPLNAIIGMNDLMMDTDLDDVQQRYTNIIKKSGVSLLRLINDILDYSRIESGKLDLEIVDFNLQEFLDDFMESLAIKAEKQGLELICNITSGVPVLVRGDPGRIRQILNNLTDNALKFTETGEVEIRVSRVSETFHEVNVQFSVRDTGVGFKEENSHLLFEHFSQLDSSITRHYGGTGLGLAISKQLVELMGGSINCISDTGTGSTFWFTVLLEKQVSDFNRQNEPLNILDLTKTKILVVNDNQTNLDILVIRLQSWGIKADICQDPHDVTKMLVAAKKAGEPYSIVIIDSKLSEINGRKLGQTIKNEPYCNNTRLILLTPNKLQSQNVDIKHQNVFDEVLCKPVRHQDLYYTLCTIVQRAMLGELAPPVKPNSSLFKYKNFATFSRPYRVLVVEDNATNQHVVLSMLEKLGLNANAVANGQEALTALENIAYDLVLMDIQMPVLDGVEATRRIRNKNTPVINHNIPIIAMTAHAMQGDKDKFLQAGMSDYLSKPFRLNDFSKILHRWLTDQFDSIDESFSAPHDISDLKGDISMNIPVFNYASFSERMMDDKEIMVSVIESFLFEMPELIRQAEETVLKNNASETESLAHSIKGVCGNIGGERMKTVAQLLENSGNNQNLNNSKKLISELKNEYCKLKKELHALLESYQKV